MAYLLHMRSQMSQSWIQRIFFSEPGGLSGHSLKIAHAIVASPWCSAQALSRKEALLWREGLPRTVMRDFRWTQLRSLDWRLGVEDFGDTDA